MTVNRFAQLLASVPTGSFYASNGQVLPYRDSPYQLRIATASANTEYIVYLNDSQRGHVITDTNSMALLSLVLYKGENTIRLLGLDGSQAAIAYITTRDYATMLAGVADVVQVLDADIESVLSDARLATASSALIESVFGAPILTDNSVGYSLDTYRDLLQEVRVAYRYFGGTKEGINRVVRAYTQITPLLYPIGFGPIWLLGTDFVASNVKYTTYPDKTSLSSGTATISVNSVNGAPGAHSLNITGSLPFTATLDGGVAVEIGTDGTYALSGSTVTFNPVISENGPFSIVSGVNDKLRLNIDARGEVDITLSSGSARTAAQVASDINTALSNDLRYGATYASIVGTVGTTTTALSIGSSASAPERHVKICPIAGQSDATQTLFNLPDVRSGLNAQHTAGSTTLTLVPGVSMSSWPSATVDEPIALTVGRTTYHPLGAPNPGVTVVTPELVYATAIDKTAHTVTLSTGLVRTHPSGATVELSGQLPYSRDVLSRPSSMGITVTNTAGITGGDSFVVNYLGSTLPDGWLVTDGSGAAVSALAQSSNVYFDAVLAPSLIPANRLVVVPVDSRALQYVGMQLNVDVWCSREDNTATTPLVDINQIGLSFDGGSTYSMVTPTLLGAKTVARNRPSSYAISARVPTNATSIKLKIATTATGGGSLVLQKVRVVADVHPGLCLGNGTTPRNETKIKQGMLVYAWCADQLSSYENEQLGLSASTQNSAGHIDTISPASCWLDKFNASIYSAGKATNVIGTFTDSDLDACSAINLSTVVRSPARFSYAQPTAVSAQEEQVSFDSITYRATISTISDQDQSSAVLFEDGIPLYKDEWSFVSSNTIQKTTAPQSQSVYTIRYNALIQLTGPVLDLGSNWQNYVWLADAHVWLRPEIKPVSVVVTKGVQFDGNSIATLSEPSDMDQPTSSLVEDTGVGQSVVPSSWWSYLDKFRIKISPSQFNPNAIYNLTYKAQVNHPSCDASYKLQVRSAADASSTSTATWTDIIPGVVDSTNRYYQLRVIASGVRDVRDVRVQSLLMKGLSLYGAGTPVPGLK